MKPKIPAYSDDGDEFEDLARSARPRAYALAVHLLGDPVEAQDLTQEALVRAWRHFRDYDRAKSFDGWICHIVTNLATDVFRRRRIVRFCSLDEMVSSSQSPALWGAYPGPEAHLMETAIDERLARALEQLPRHYREPLIAAAIGQEAHSAIAERMRCPVPTVRSRIHRARQMMRNLLREASSTAAE